MQFSDTLSPSCLCGSSVHCSLEHPFRHLRCSRILNFPQEHQLPSNHFLSLSVALRFSHFCLCTVSELYSITLHCNEGSSFRETVFVCVCCNYCSLIAFQSHCSVFCSSPNHHTRANYNTLNSAAAVCV